MKGLSRREVKGQLHTGNGLTEVMGDGADVKLLKDFGGFGVKNVEHGTFR